MKRAPSGGEEDLTRDGAAERGPWVPGTERGHVSESRLCEESEGEFEVPKEIQTNLDVEIRSSVSSGLWYKKSMYLVFVVVSGTERLIPWNLWSNGVSSVC